MKIKLFTLISLLSCLSLPAWDFEYQEEYIDARTQEVELDLLNEKSLNKYIEKSFPKSFHRQDPFYRPTALDQYFQLQKNSIIQGLD